MRIKVSLKDAKDKVLLEQMQDDITVLVFKKRYQLGDYYEIELEKPNSYIVVQLDPILNPALIYIQGNHWRYNIPFNFQRYPAMADGSFEGIAHYACVREATTEEILREQNLAYNSHDQHQNSGAFPHVTANAETRNEDAFLAKNVIDGYLANKGHGRFPFQSWGIDQRDDAELKLDFGREVLVKKIGILLRADFPHDNYWTKADITFSDGTTITLNLEKTDKIQYFSVAKKKSRYLKLNHLCKAADGNNAFPSLSQLLVWGTNIN